MSVEHQELATMKKYHWKNHKRQNATRRRKDEQNEKRRSESNNEAMEMIEEAIAFLCSLDMMECVVTIKR